MTAHTTFHWYFDQEARLAEEMLLARLDDLLEKRTASYSFSDNHL